MTEQQETTETLLLYAARDAKGQLFLTDERSLLPSGVEDIREFRVAPEKVAWAILQVQVEEIRATAVMIRVGDCHYATQDTVSAPERRIADTVEKGET